MADNVGSIHFNEIISFEKLDQDADVKFEQPEQLIITDIAR